MKGVQIKVSPEFAAIVDKLAIGFNGDIEKMAQMKFGDNKPITKVLVTEMIARQIDTSKLRSSIDIDLNKYRLKL